MNHAQANFKLHRKAEDFCDDDVLKRTHNNLLLAQAVFLERVTYSRKLLSYFDIVKYRSYLSRQCSTCVPLILRFLPYNNHRTMISYQGLPPLDVQDGIFRAWWFDPLVATVCFGAFINVYWYQERKLGLSCNDKFAETCKSHRRLCLLLFTVLLDTDDARLLPIDSTHLFPFISAWLLFLPGGFGLGPLFNSAAAYWIGIFFWKLVVPPAAPFIPDGVPSNVSELTYLLTEVVTGIVLYDAVFFFLHWAMHEIPYLRTWHARHHDRPEGTLECRDTLRHGIMDGSLQVLINILVQRQNPWASPKSRLARAMHNIIVIWMLTESHTNSPVPYIWRRWFVGVREHRLHHYGALKQGAYGKHHRHQQFFGYLDDTRARWTERKWRARIV